MASSASHGSSSRRALIVVGVVLLAGALLRTAQFVSAGSLWHDEIRLAMNVEERGLVDLVSRPLDHDQVAPIGFLALLEAATTVFGASERALRAGPWLLGLAALFLFWRVSRRFLSPISVITGLAVFAFAIGWIWFGTSPKQYGADITVTLLLVWLALRWRDDPADLRLGVLGGIGGGAAILLSHPAVIVAFLIALVLVVMWWRSEPRLPAAPVAALTSGWAAGALLVTISSLVTLDGGTDTFMREFHAEGFPPSPADPIAFLLWAPRQLAEALGVGLYIQPGGPLWIHVGILCALAAVGLIYLARRHPRFALLLSIPILAGILAAAAQLLPFRVRLAVYAAWPVLVFSMWGIEAIWRSLPGRSRHVATVLAVLVAVPLVLLSTLALRPPLPTQESRGILTELDRRREPNDTIYVACGGRYAVEYYGESAGIGDWDPGECHDDLRAYLHEIDAFRGRPRVWVFQTQSHGEAEALKEYLATIGVVRDSIPDPWRFGMADAFLYDLSDADRLASATAETFPIQEEVD